MADYTIYKYKQILPRAHDYDYDVNGFDQAATYHPFFGKIKVHTVGADNYVADNSPAAIQSSYRDYVSRELGFSRELDMNNRILKGIAQPRTYLYNRNVAMNNLVQDLGDEYQRRFISLINLGHKKDEADRRALKYVQEIGKLRQKEIDEMYPTTLTQEAIERLNKKNKVGNLTDLPN